MSASHSVKIRSDGDFVDDLESLSYAVARQRLTVREVVLPADQHVVLQGMRFHYLDWGTQGRPPILFLHGGGLNAHTFDLICLALRHDYHCVSLDQRGHGDSEWSPTRDYEITTHAADIRALIEHLGFDRLVLVGMSMGGLNAIQYAADHVGHLTALVLIDVAPTVQAQGSQRVRDFLAQPAEADSIDEFVERAMLFNPRRDRRLLRRSLLHNLRPTPDGKWAWKWDARPRRTSEAHIASQRRMELWDSSNLITCPVLVVRGGESDVLTEEAAAAFARRLPNGRHVVVENAGHTVQGDNPAGLVREIRRFFATTGL